jgi:nucleoside phosphorylase
MDKIRHALILAPMTSELRPLVKRAKGQRLSVDNRTVHTARIGDIDLIIAQLGVGPAAARATTEWALNSFKVDHVLVSGIAGGLSPDLAVGAVVVPESVLDLASGKVHDASPIEGVAQQGMVATADHLISDQSQLDQLQTAGVIALEMESSGVAAACEAAGRPWTTFRVISDRPDQQLTDDTILSLLRPDGSPRVAAALGLMARHPNRIRVMMRLARDSSMAATLAARCTLDALACSG